MTNDEYRKKYPIGTKIKYVGSKGWDSTGDIGKIGWIVGYHHNSDPLIFLPESENISECHTRLRPVSWWTSWVNIEILPQKNEQLLFAFMDAMEGT